MKRLKNQMGEINFTHMIYYTALYIFHLTQYIQNIIAK